MNMDSYIDALDLAGYISYKYRTKFKSNISNIKLQKSLYFLFAYWGGFVRRTQIASGEGQIEATGQEYKPNLFDNRIEAWIYGPVVVDVYHHFAPHLIKEDEVLKKITELPAEVVSFIDDMLEDLFSVSDFKLVDISHADRCWKDNFDENAERHNNEIPKEEIINEYSER